MSRKAVIEKFQNDIYDISVTGRNVLVTDAMQDYAIDKVSKIDRFSNRVVDVNVVMDIQKLEHRVDITMKVDQIVVRSTASSDNMYASIDKAVDRLKSQLTRYKQRLRDHQIKAAAYSEISEMVIAEALENEVEAYNDEITAKNSSSLVDSYTPHHIVSKSTRPLKTLNYQEAIMKIELSGEPFIVFRGEEDNKLKVIYPREDGNFGIIEPE